MATHHNLSRLETPNGDLASCAKNHPWKQAFKMHDKTFFSVTWNNYAQLSYLSCLKLLSEYDVRAFKCLKSSQVVYISLFSTHWMAFVGHRTTQQHFNHIHHKIFSKDEGKKKKKKRKKKPSWTYLIHCCQTNTNFFLNCQKGKKARKAVAHSCTARNKNLIT